MIVVNEKNCTGCRACEFACSFQQKKSFHYNFSLIRIIKNKENEGFFIPNLCHHCKDTPCAKECPTDAIGWDVGLEMVIIDKQKCTGCGLCVSLCPWSIPIIDSEEDIAKICDFCKGDPLCVKFCNPGALSVNERRG
jgi:Fe-S-cluster-containing hydrogenase component 2